MTQILNVPMPADSGIDIINWMFASNSMIVINIDLQDFWNMVIKWLTIKQPMQKEFGYKRITINSITPIIPTYSVWDQVMILATGEIGEVSSIVDEDVRSIGFKGVCGWSEHHWSKICKIA